MKKLLTIVLALVMVFAIAAPALAITGDVGTPTTPGSGAPVAIDTTLLASPATSTGFGGFSLTTVAANKLYVVNEMAYFCVAVKFNTTTALNAGDYTGSVLNISSDAIAITAAPTMTGFTSAGGTIATPWVPAWAQDVDTKVWTSATPQATDYLSGNVYYFVGQGLVGAKGVLKATFGLTAVSPVEIYSTGAVVLYTVAEVATGFTVTNADGDIVTFEIDADEEVTGIFVTLSGATVAGAQEVQFRKLVSGGGSIVQAVGTYADAELTEAKALYATVMTFFGFNYDAEGILELRHFASKAALLNLKDESAVTLYTGSLVIPGGAEVPKTGDAASIMGFVMITLAMVAAGFVVSRKVRA